MARRFTLAPLLLTLAGCEAAAATAGPATVSTERAAEVGTNPVLLELFTSQGCSSCPPADAHAATSVRSGENARRTLRNASIVRALAPCDAAASRCTVRFDSEAAEHHVVAWVQRGSTMEILGVGLSEIATSS